MFLALTSDSFQSLDEVFDVPWKYGKLARHVVLGSASLELKHAGTYWLMKVQTGELKRAKT